MMTGETKAWMDLAKYLGMSLQRCQWETTSSEFSMWKVHMEEEVNEFHREDHFLAQVAAEIYRIYCALVGKREKINPDDFLIPFVFKGEEKKLSQEEYTQRSKTFWKMLGGTASAPPDKVRPKG